MNTEYISIFVEVARRGSFAAAARHLDKDPSLISRGIAALENEMGVRLFQRSTRRIALTEAGTVFLARVAPAAEEVERAIAEASAVTTHAVGVLRLSASVAFGEHRLVPLLPAFREAYPDLKIELLLNDNAVDLVAERVDLAVRLGVSVMADCVMTKLVDTGYSVVASPTWIAANRAVQVPGDLMQVDCLLHSLPEYQQTWLFQNDRGVDNEVTIHGQMMMTSVNAIRKLALLGQGPALLANWLVAPDVRAGNLINLFPKYRAAATRFDTAAWLIYPSRAFLPHKVRVAVDFLKAQFLKG